MMWICLAVNDDCGQTTEGIRAANFDEWLSLECREVRPTGFTKIDANRVRIGRRVFPITGYRSWLGNMYWEGIKVTYEVAQQIAEYLRTTGKYQPDMGVCDVWDAWDANAPIEFKDED